MATTHDAPRGAPDRRGLGQRGEDVAAAFLAARGLVLLDRNWRCREGELDLVAADGDRLVVAEVKTRSGTGFGTAEAVTRTKAARIRRLAQRWLAARHAAGGAGFAEVRFDVLAVLLGAGCAPRVEHYEGAF